jgi:predicted nucleic acid-binding protein
MRVAEVPERIVVDASVGLKWVLREEHSDRAVALGSGRETIPLRTRPLDSTSAAAAHPALADRVVLLRDIALR